jgi:hypothetical protein
MRPVVERETSRFPVEERPYMPGSLTTQSRPHTRDGACDHIAFRLTDGVGALIVPFAAQYLAYMPPCRRFAPGFTADSARLGADAGRYSFIVVDFHHLLLASLPAHLSPQFLPAIFDIALSLNNVGRFSAPPAKRH